MWPSVTRFVFKVTILVVIWPSPATLAAPFRKFYRDQGLANKLVNAEWESFLARKFGPGAE